MQNPPGFLQTLQRDMPLLVGLLCLTGFFQWYAGDGGGQWLALVAGLVAAYYGLYRFVACRSPVVSTLSWLGIPYALFALGWLRWPYALLLLVAVGWACLALVRRTRDIAPAQDGWAGYLVVLAWVYLSGAGGYGLQVADYLMHNGRLKDLIDYPWPVHYANGQYLVGYIGYYLPGALVGKWAGWGAAMLFMHLWTVAGAWLVLRWLQVLLNERHLGWLALALVFFGGWDWFGHALANGRWPWALDWTALRANPEPLDFWAGAAPTGFFLGSFVSHAFSLAWSPHQVIAGWLVALMMLAFYRRQDVAGVLTAHGLLSLWSPMIAVALLLFSVLALVTGWRRQGKAVLNAPGLLFVVVVLPMFAAFYLSGSTLHNPAFVIWTAMPPGIIRVVPILVMVLGWGIYALAIQLSGIPWDAARRTWWVVLLVSLVALPQLHYGAYSDLFCRGAAALLMLLFVEYWHFLQQSRRGWRIVAILLLVPGCLSGVMMLSRSLADYQHKAVTTSVADYQWQSEFTGEPDAFFMQYLMKRSSP